MKSMWNYNQNSGKCSPKRRGKIRLEKDRKNFETSDVFLSGEHKSIEYIRITWFAYVLSVLFHMYPIFKKF